MNNKKYLLMLTRLGYSTSNVRAKRNGGTVITDILLSNQYQVIPNQEIQHQATSGVKIIEIEVS